MRNVEDIALDLCSLYYDSKPAINSNGELEYFLVGSLATLPLLCADSIEDVVLDDSNRVISFENKQVIDEQTRNTLRLYRRQIHDVDYVSIKSEPNKGEVVRQVNDIKDIAELSSIGARVINVSDPREQNCKYNLCRITCGERQMIIPSPIDIISFKLSQCVGRKKLISKWKAKEQDERTMRVINKNLEEYMKQIRDIIPLINGIVNLYSADQIASRMAEILTSENKNDLDILNEIKTDLNDNPLVLDIFDKLGQKKLQ